MLKMFVILPTFNPFDGHLKQKYHQCLSAGDREACDEVLIAKWSAGGIAELGFSMHNQT